MLEQGAGFDYRIERVFQEYRYAGSKFFFLVNVLFMDANITEGHRGQVE